MDAFYGFIQQIIKYPKEARENKRAGKSEARQGLKDGQPVDVRMTLPVMFKLG
jgi:hypothetical protein